MVWVSSRVNGDYLCREFRMYSWTVYPVCLVCIKNWFKSYGQEKYHCKWIFTWLIKNNKNLVTFVQNVLNWLGQGLSLTHGLWYCFTILNHCIISELDSDLALLRSKHKAQHVTVLVVFNLTVETASQLRGLKCAMMQRIVENVPVAL